MCCAIQALVESVFFQFQSLDHRTHKIGTFSAKAQLGPYPHRPERHIGIAISGCRGLILGVPAKDPISEPDFAKTTLGFSGRTLFGVRRPLYIQK